MKRRDLALLLVLAVAFIFALSGMPALATMVTPGHGVSFNQVNFTWPGATTLNSNTGQVDVDIATLKAQTGISSGYINVTTSLGWVVQNLPVFQNFLYPSISTKFKLSTSSGIDVTSFEAFVDFSPTPVTSFAGGLPTTFAVGDTRFNAEGYGTGVSIGPPSPPPPGVISFILGGILKIHLKPGIPNVETASDQCGPAAAANSLQWLEDTYDIPIPQPHIPGLGIDTNGDTIADAGDGTLVGYLDALMARGFTSRMNGDSNDPDLLSDGVSGEQFLEGKLEYIAINGLDDDLIVRHQSADGVPGGGDFTRRGVTSIGDGAAPTPNFIIEQVAKSEDVELGYRDPGGHFVTLAGAGTILGIPFILHRSDQVQSSDDAVAPPDAIDNNEGTAGTQFAFLVDIDGDGLYNLVGEPGDPEATIVVSESPKPPPTGVNTYWLAALALLAMAMGLVVIKRAKFLRA